MTKQEIAVELMESLKLEEVLEKPYRLALNAKLEKAIKDYAEAEESE